MQNNSSDEPSDVAIEMNMPKKRKLSEKGECHDDANEVRSSFEGFSVKTILNEDVASKTIFVEGTFDSVEGNAVVILEKLPFGKENVRKMLSNETTLINKFQNNIYGSYTGYPKSELNSIKATIIHPATEKHRDKYQFHPLFVVRETPKIYQEVVLPFINSHQFSLKWVYNILEHKSEAERIIFEDTDKEQGFILIPDLKWDETQISNLYVSAICNNRGIKSLRDLTADDLPLLKNISSKSYDEIYKKYNLPRSKIRAYFHYLPSYYHLHVHFNHVEYSVPGIQVERAHLLESVICNLELMPDYYQKVDLTFAVKENDELYGKLVESGAMSK